MPLTAELKKQDTSTPSANTATNSGSASGASTTLPANPVTSVAANSSSTSAPTTTAPVKAAGPSVAGSAMAMVGGARMAASAKKTVADRTAKSQTMTGAATDISAGRDDSDDESVGDQAKGVVDDAFGVIGDAKDEFEDGYKAVNEAQGKEEDDLSETVQKDMKGLAVAASVMGTASGIKAMSDSLTTLMDPNKEFLDKIEAGFEMGEGIAGTVGAASDFTNEVASEGSKVASDSEAVSAWSGSVGDAIGAIKTGFLTVKQLVTTIKERNESSKREKAIEGLGIAQGFVETGKSVLTVINGVKEALDGGTFGGVTAAIPGLDIALSGIAIIKEGFYLVISYRDYKQMIAEKESKEKDPGSVVKEKSEELRKYDATISNYKVAISEDEEKSAQLEEKIKTASDETGFFKSTSDKQRLINEKKALDANILKMKNKTAVVAVQKNDLEAANPEVLEYAMVGEIAEANKKRIVRNSILLVAEFANLAGSIANLTGVGAIAGASLKAASASVKVALPAARVAKQAGRDRHAAKEARGESDVITSGFDASKSTAAKRDYRMKQVNTLLQQIQNLKSLKGAAFDSRAKQLEMYISAMGVSPGKLFAQNGNQKEQITMLYKALIQREI